MTNATLMGKLDAGNPHVRFDEGEVASAKPRRGSSFTNGSRFAVAVLLFAAGLFAPTIQADDLPVLAFWQFNSSDPLADSSGNGKTLSQLSGAQVSFVGNRAIFRPENTSGLNRNMDFRSVNALTVEFFVRLGTYRAANVALVNFFNWNGADTGFFGLNGGSNRTPYSFDLTASWHNGSEQKRTTSGGLIEDRKWHHVALVMDATSDDASATDGELTIYIDGVKRSVVSGTATHHTKAFPNATNFIIGMWGGVWTQVHPGDTAFAGEIDDIRLTGAALTPEQFLSAPTLVETEHEEEAVEWTSTSLMPTAGADVYVPTTSTVVIAEGTVTPKFASVVVDGEIIFTGSNVCLNAESVVVGPSGRLQGGAPYGGTSVSNQIKVACGDFTIKAGGFVNANGTGFRGGYKGYFNGAGPGAGKNDQDNRASSGSHGSFNSSSPLAHRAYGSAEFPETAGSGGYANNWNSGTDMDMAAGNGGGVVRIDATGEVKIDGTVDASGSDLYLNVSYGRSSGGSGGSIWIDCAKLSGSGVLSARGGASTGNERHASWAYSSPGAGGRIAVHYDAAVQTAAMAKELVFEVQAGISRPYTYSYSETGFWMFAGAGTLWFPDVKLIAADNLSNFRGRLVNAAEVTLDGDVVVSNWVGFATDGVKLHVKGDLTVASRDGRLEIGSVRQHTGDNNIQRRSYVSDTASSLVVDGNFVVTNAARFDVYAAATSVAQPVGALIEAQSFTIATNCFVYPLTDPANGGAAFFSVTNFNVLSGGTFGIAGGGYSGRKGDVGYGPGYGTSTLGAGYGGFGGRVRTWEGEVATTNTTKYGQMYGDALRPTMAGSGGGHWWAGQNGGGVGGGVLQVRATASIFVAGTLSADGTTPQGYNNGSTGGSGGSILLEAPVVTIAPTAKITARGGDSGTTTPNAGCFTCGGGGGRIAIWTGKFFWEPTWRKSRYAVSEEIPAGLSSVFDVSGGVSRVASRSYAGEAGTLRFVTTVAPPGAALIIR